MIKAVYAGSFDPPTLGHASIIRRAATLFGEKLILAIGVNSAKTPIFSVGERLELLAVETESLDVELRQFDGLLVDFCRRVGATVIIRGLRASMDFEYEMGIAQANAKVRPEIQTIFMPTEPEHSFVASSVVKEIARLGGSVRAFVSPHVEQALWAKFGHSPK